MRKTAVEMWTSGAVVEQGLDLAAQVGATASEAVRSRREPAQVARRRQRAARRRLRSWSAATVVTVAGGAGAIAVGGLSAPVIVALVFLSLLLALCVVRGVRAAGDLRARNREVADLPPPSPRRVAVAGELRPAIARLDGYSDGLRRLVTMIGLVEDDRVLAVRAEVIAAADATERQLRDRAAEASTLIRARRRAAADVGGDLDGSVAAMRREIEAGVAGYGRLVAAANEAADATRGLARGAVGGPMPALPGSTAVSALPGPTAPGALPGSTAPGVLPGRAATGLDHVVPGERAGWDVHEQATPELVEAVDRLRALAAGLRELGGR